VSPDPVAGKARAVGARIAGGAGLAGVLGTPGVIAATQPVVGAALFAVELALVCVLLMTLLYGSEERGERVFRLLRWVKDKPEPAVRVPSPGDGRVRHQQSLDRYGDGTGRPRDNAEVRHE
jgi:hypothetical protein